MTQPVHDVIIVGSGASGSWAAKALTERGLDVLLLEAGPIFGASALPASPRDPAGQQPIQSRCYAFNTNTRGLFVDDSEHPYHSQEGDFCWIRGRQLGGRMHLWGAHCLRLSELDFKAALRDDIGVCWPLGHEELDPHYRVVERFLRIRGQREGLPHMPDGELTEPFPLTRHEHRFKRDIEAVWPERRVTPGRYAQTCFGAVLDSALATGRLRIRPNSVVSHLVLGGSDRVESVAFFDRVSRRQHEARGRVVLLCASTIESTRIVLNSGRQPGAAGFANSSGLVGRHLMDHVIAHGAYESRRCVATEPTPEWSGGFYVPRFRNIARNESARFRRGYGIQAWIWPEGPRLKLTTTVFGEVLPTADNRVELHPEVRDAWGIPVPSIRYRYGENERALLADVRDSVKEMAAAAGFDEASEPRHGEPGMSVHEAGTLRMGECRRTSVLNAYCQSWDCENLFVTDASCFPSIGCQNPTLTLLALTSRACAHISDRLGKNQH